MIERLKDLLRDWWNQRVAWVSIERHPLGNSLQNEWAPIVIVGREYYREARKSYPIRGYRELSSALALEVSPGRTALSFIGPWQEDRREVAIFELDAAFVAAEQRSMLWIPESLLISRSLDPSQIADVDRFGIRYFCSAAGASQLRGGLIRTPESYAMGVGVASSGEPLSLDESALRSLLLQQLLKLTFGDWIRAIQPGLWPQVARWLQPATIMVGVSAALYLLIVSAYLAGITKWREYQLARLGPQVGTLLSMQRKVDAVSKEVDLLAGALGARPDSYRLWELTSVIWKTEGTVVGLTLIDGEVTIRGTAVVATDILSAIGKLKGFEGAKFGAPVRQSGSREEFTIVVRLAPVIEIKAT